MIISNILKHVWEEHKNLKGGRYLSLQMELIFEEATIELLLQHKYVAVTIVDGAPEYHWNGWYFTDKFFVWAMMWATYGIDIS